MVEDARARTKVWLETYVTPATLTWDDDSTEACFIVCYGKPDYPLVRVFREKNVDVVFSIGKPTSTPLLGHDQTPYGYEENVPIKIFAVDKAAVTGTKAVWQAEAELRRITETYPTGSVRSLERVGDRDQDLGSTKLYCTEYVLNYRRDTT